MESGEWRAESGERREEINVPDGLPNAARQQLFCDGVFRVVDVYLRLNADEVERLNGLAMQGVMDEADRSREQVEGDGAATGAPGANSDAPVGGADGGGVLAEVGARNVDEEAAGGAETASPRDADVAFRHLLNTTYVTMLDSLQPAIERMLQRAIAETEMAEAEVRARSPTFRPHAGPTPVRPSSTAEPLRPRLAGLAAGGGAGRPPPSVPGGISNGHA